MYSAGWLLNELNKSAIKYFVGIKSNRTVVSDEGKKVCQIKSLVTGLTGNALFYRDIKYIVKSTEVLLRNMGHPVKLFWIKNSFTGKERYSVTNNLGISEEEAVEKYYERVQIDVVFFKIAKSVLLLDEGKFQKLIGYTRHYYFPALAFTILTYVSKQRGVTIFCVKQLLNF